MRDDIDIRFFQERLEARRQEILDGQQTVNPPELDQSRVGRLSRMDAMQQQAMSRAAARLADMEVQRIHTALERIVSGEYGYCMRCDEEIAEGRLRADPGALICIACARALEGR
jgi:DnaK suppressor protein